MSLEPKLFNDNSAVNREILKGERNVAFFVRMSEDNREGYELFDAQFDGYLQRLPEGPLRKYVGHLFNLKKIFLGSSFKHDGIFATYFLTSEDRVAGVVLDFVDLDLGLKAEKDGFVMTKLKNPADAAAAVYFCLLRAATVVFKQEVRQDVELHRPLVEYLYRLFLRLLGPLSGEARKNLFFASGFMFYCYYLKENVNYAVSFLKREFSQLWKMDDFLEERLRRSSFRSLKDLPAFFHELDIASGSERRVLPAAREMLGKHGFISVFGPLDFLVAGIVVARYPVSFFPRKMMVKEETHRRVEGVMERYLGRLPYDLTAVH